MRFWETTWGQLAPGDHIQAPDGSTWAVGAAIIHEGQGEWEITHPLRGTAWTAQAEAGAVMATRPFAPQVDMDAEKVLGIFRLAFGEGVELVSKEAAKLGPDAPRWIKCGQKVCVCKW